MPTIEVDFDVYKALIARRPTENVTENDVLRQLLHLPKLPGPSARDLPAREDWMTKGVRIPAGTELRAKYKGRFYVARVEDGALLLEGRRFDSPSAAAMSISQNVSEIATPDIGSCCSFVVVIFRLRLAHQRTRLATLSISHRFETVNMSKNRDSQVEFKIDGGLRAPCGSHGEDASA